MPRVERIYRRTAAGLNALQSNDSGLPAEYRRILQRIDPSSWGGTGTIIQFNSLKFNFSDPFVSLLPLPESVGALPATLRDPRRRAPRAAA